MSETEGGVGADYAVTATDQQIDSLVYSFYGLTQEEIELVEKN